MQVRYPPFILSTLSLDQRYGILTVRYLVLMRKEWGMLFSYYVRGKNHKVLTESISTDYQCPERACTADIHK